MGVEKAHQGSWAAHNLALEVVLRSVAWAHELVLVLQQQHLSDIHLTHIQTALSSLDISNTDCPISE